MERIQPDPEIREFLQRSIGVALLGGGDVGIRGKSMSKINTKMLRDAAYELGLSTYQLAAAAGVPQPFVSNILLGTGPIPSAEKLKAICHVLDLTVADVTVTAEKVAA